ncbi:hypothetical protein PV371_38825 [Streptomyces sp. TX20-6-3]|uniref:hypothetical protein n=1 Tax=Streptomyces sp. TX20-6-3 TaxID=3028705 RepID=UPI0029AA594B|nr:hypothetical protein [Streptomyces sp. TX20-6-3]MDX2565462.1 hypothetical protein [Streptomyces sp. TX20-6-3]
MKNWTIPFKSLLVCAFMLLLIVFAAAYFSIKKGGGVGSEGAGKSKLSAACKTMDEIFTPRGVVGKEQLLQHLVKSSLKLAKESSGELQEAARVHASYVQEMYREAKDASPGTSGPPSKSNIPASAHERGLKAYEAIRKEAWKQCSFDYLSPPPMPAHS